MGGSNWIITVSKTDYGLGLPFNVGGIQAQAVYVSVTNSVAVDSWLFLVAKVICENKFIFCVLFQVSKRGVVVVYFSVRCVGYKVYEPYLDRGAEHCLLLRFSTAIVLCFYTVVGAGKLSFPACSNRIHGVLLATTIVIASQVRMLPTFRWIMVSDLLYIPCCYSRHNIDGTVERGAVLLQLTLVQQTSIVSWEEIQNMLDDNSDKLKLTCSRRTCQRRNL